MATVSGVDLTTTAVAAAAGVLTGPWVRAVVFRLSVPADEAERTTCSRCGRTLRPTFACRCPSCGERVALSCGATEIVSAAALGTMAVAVGPRPELVAFCWLTVLCVALATIDLLVYRLPDRLTLSAYPLLAGLFAAAALANGEPAQFLRALLAGAALATGYLVLALIRPGQLGLGDVKLAGLLGLALGWISWGAVLLATALSFVLCGAVGLVLLTTGHARRGSVLPLGPFMVYSTFVIALVTQG